MEIFNSTSNKTMTIMLCSYCNTKCKHCYLAFNGKRDDEQSLSNLISNLQKEEYTVLLNGSEPLLFPEYIKYFKQANQECIFTNGRVIVQNPSIIDKIKNAGIKTVCLSYHYKIQNLVSEISFNEVEKAISLIKEKNLQVCLMCTLCKENYKDIDKICQKAYELGASELHFTNFICCGESIKNNLKYLTLNEDEILYCLNEINKQRLCYDKSKLYISRCGTFGNNIGSKNYKCRAGLSDFVLTPDNKIWPCIFVAGINGYEMGLYKNGKITFNRNCKTNSNVCFAKEIFNYNKNNYLYD